MSKRRIFSILILTLIWVILSENFSPASWISGFLISIVCTILCRKFLPLSTVKGVKFHKLLFYPIYVITQIYIAGFHAIKLIIFDSKVEIVEIKTALKQDILRVALANSITLTPGTISLRLREDKITVLWLRSKKPLGQGVSIDESIKGKMERKLIKAEK